MKTLVKLAILLLSLNSGMSLSAGPRNNGPRNGGTPPPPAVTVAPLSADEAATLTWMREEEKLARDVYRTLYTSTRATVFKRIAASEQSHMDALLKKLTLFNVPDPVVIGTGLFSDPELQALYTSLVNQGSVSYLDALVVGATIEDLDIRDLLAAVEATDNLALLTTYQNLLEGSKNHLRAFVSLLNQNGATYQPQYIDQELYDAILGL
jgi:hypothetical protein